MRKFRHLSLVLFLIPLALFAAPGSGSMEFVENKGQWAEAFRYKAASANSAIFLENNTFTYLVGAADNAQRIEDQKFGKVETTTLHFHAYKMVFEGANPTPVITGGLAQQHYYNYYLGNDQKRWRSGIHPNLEVNYKAVYKNIDLHVSSEGDNLKYDFIVQPGADPSIIKLRYDGIEKVSVKDGKLQLLTSVGTIEEMKPYAYQTINGLQVKVFCRYKVTGNTVTYSFPDDYDHSTALIIDPTVVFATFTGSKVDNWGFTATYDAAGNFYAGGIALGNGYPFSPGAIQTSFQGGSNVAGNGIECDISISKFNAIGSALIFSTYLGGASNEQPHSLIVDASDDLILAGRSYSANFPVTSGCYDNTANGSGDLIVVKMNNTGTALIGSTYVGGSAEDITNFTSAEFGHGNLKHNYGDDARSEVIVDKSGNIYVAACTKSTDFPTTPTAIKATLTSGDKQDAVVVKLNSTLTSLLWSTYLGGTSDDAAYVLALDKSETSLFVGGGTMSSDFPGTAGSYTPTYQGAIDGFIAKFTNGGSYPLQVATYIGKSGYDQCYGVQVDAANNLYAMGQTIGGTFPVSSGVYSNPFSSQFIIKLNNTLTTNLLSTVYGSGDPTATNISPVAFLVDTCGNIYISGWGGNLFGPGAPAGTGTTVGMPVNGSAGPAAQSTTDGQDFYFIVLSQNMGALLYGTFMGTSGGVGEHVDGGTSRFDKNGIVYQAICGGCGAGVFPTTAGAYSAVNGSNNCNLVALKIAFFLGPVKAGLSVSPTAFACLGTPFTFINTSSNASSYLWDMGDGNTYSVVTPPPHTYAAIGTYTIRLIANNPLSCNLSDTVKVTVKVDSNTIDASFLAKQLDTCAPFTTIFTNTSRLSKTPGSTTYFWDFGDGGTSTLQNPPNKNYTAAGTYTIKLIVTDPTACNSPDSATQTVFFRDDNVIAAFDVPDLICLGDSFAPSNTSVKALTYLWNFGDKKTSTLERPGHKFDSAGTYTVTLYAYNPTTCNKVDSLSKTIEVKPSPLADFTFTPIVPVTNEITKFTNLSKNAIHYNWSFGDGDGTEETDPQHFYKRTGTYTVCLVAMNKEGCADTACKAVAADVLPLADIPNAFSPNGDGNNDLLFVFGAAIDKMNLKIYNRWGQLVFESNDIKRGWDGTFNGKPQEVEAYAYVLNVTFVDGTTLNKQGNVTLLR